MIVVGIDQGLDCPGIATVRITHASPPDRRAVFSDLSLELLESEAFKPPKLLSEPQTFYSIAQWAGNFVSSSMPHLVAVEQPVAAHANASLIASAGCVGAVRYRLYEMGHEAMLIQPTHMKSMFTGNGRAKKPEIVDACRELFGKDILRKLAQDERWARADAIGVAVTAYLDKWALPGKVKTT